MDQAYLDDVYAPKDQKDIVLKETELKRREKEKDQKELVMQY